MDTLPTAPPTRPGALGTRTALPISRLAIWSLVCGLVGLFPIPLGVGGIALGIVAIRRIRRIPGRERGLGLAIAGIVTGAIGLLLMTFIYVMMTMSITAQIGQVRAMRTQANLPSIHERMARYGRRHGYPAHVAQLALDGKGGFRWYSTMRAMFGKDQTVVVTVGEYDMADFDDSVAERRQLREALATIDVDASYYQFGACWFVRLPRPTNDPDIIFAWQLPQDARAVLLLMDDGTVTSALPREWPARVRDDAIARKKLGLPAIVLPSPFSQ